LNLIELNINKSTQRAIVLGKLLCARKPLIFQLIVRMTGENELGLFVEGKTVGEFM
jgi:hypothetical protein